MDACQLLHAHRGEPPRRHQRPLEELGRFEIPVHRAGTFGCLQRVPPCFLETLGVQVVQRQGLSPFFRLRSSGHEEGIGHPPVQLAAQPVREPVVGAVTQQGMAKNEVPLFIGGDELRQPVPEVVGRVRDGLEYGSEELLAVPSDRARTPAAGSGGRPWKGGRCAPR